VNLCRCVRGKRKGRRKKGGGKTGQRFGVIQVYRRGLSLGNSSRTRGGEGKKKGYKLRIPFIRSLLDHAHPPSSPLPGCGSWRRGKKGKERESGAATFHSRLSRRPPPASRQHYPYFALHKGGEKKKGEEQAETPTGLQHAIKDSIYVNPSPFPPLSSR